MFPTEGEEINSTIYVAELGYAGGDHSAIKPKDLASNQGLAILRLG